MRAGRAGVVRLPSIPKIAVAKNLDSGTNPRRTRMAPLVPLLQKRGLQLTEKHADNFELSAFPGLIGSWRRKSWRGGGVAVFAPMRLDKNSVDLLKIHDADLVTDGFYE